VRSCLTIIFSKAALAWVDAIVWAVAVDWALLLGLFLYLW
jgi:hypothetical protein